MRRLKVLVRVYFRALRRWLTGRWATVPRLMPRAVLTAEMIRRARIYWDTRIKRRKNNRDLLTGMVVALIAGPNLPPWSSWEHFKAHAGRKRNGAKGLPSRLVGWPVVYKSPKSVKLGVTEFLPDYAPRAEQLAERKMKRQQPEPLKAAA